MTTLTTGSLEKRVGALEISHGMGGGGPRCPDCGGRWDGEPDPDATYELVFVEEDEEMPEEDLYCEHCGRLLEGVLRFPDDAALS